MAATFTAPVKINGQEVPALMNLKAKVSIMLSDLVKKLRLPIFYTFVVTIAGITRASKRFIGLYENVFININKVVYKTII